MDSDKQMFIPNQSRFDNKNFLDDFDFFDVK